MATPAFDDLSDAYEAMINWPRRLANEEPFYRWLFQRIGAKRILDAACGTGRHAALFASWGLDVEGADLSPSLVERCRTAFGQRPGLNWTVRSFCEPANPPAAFDACVCVGNSLALAEDEPTARAALRALMQAVRDGGALVVQVANVWRLPDGPCRWQKCLRATLPAGQSLIIKGIRRSGARGFVDLLVTALEPDHPTLRSESVPFLAFEAEQLAEMTLEAGAAAVEVYGSYQRDTFDRASSEDLLLVALR